MPVEAVAVYQGKYGVLYLLRAGEVVAHADDKCVMLIKASEEGFYSREPLYEDETLSEVTF